MPLSILRPLPKRHDPRMPREPLAILKETFGYPAFRGRQADVVSHVVAGGSCLVLMPTGGGKSLCFQIPALARPGLGLVVSPLIALMQDQVAALKQAGVKAEFYNSTLDQGQKSAIRAAALSGELELLYVAPETLNTDFFQGFVGQLDLGLIAVDEAHCVSQWGHDFRPDYLHVAMLREIHPRVPLIALTATADPLTRKEILVRLGLEDQPVFASSFDRPNIKYEVTLKDEAKRQLLGLVRSRHNGEAGIVYCLSRKKVEETAEWLVAQGVKALPYHAGLDAKVRTKNQARFLREDGIVMVATIAFGMGIDKPDVRFVVHLDLPKSVESYYQETGRAGRDGQPSSAWMIYGLGDVVTLQKMIDQGEGSDEFKRLQQQKLGSLLGLCESVQCRRQSLLAYFDEAHPGGCGNCDNCLDAPKTWDGTEAARKALSAVARTGERFGTGHAIDVLLGKKNEKITRNRHDELTVWGIGKELPESQLEQRFQTAGCGQLGGCGRRSLRGLEAERPLLDPAERRGDRPLPRRPGSGCQGGGPGRQTGQDPFRRAPGRRGRRSLRGPAPIAPPPGRRTEPAALCGLPRFHPARDGGAQAGQPGRAGPPARPGPGQAGALWRGVLERDLPFIWPAAERRQGLDGLGWRRPQRGLKQGRHRDEDLAALLGRPDARTLSLLRAA